MTDNQLIYFINQSRPMSRRWQRLTIDERRQFLAFCKPLESEREIKPFYERWRKEKRQLVNAVA